MGNNSADTEIRPVQLSVNVRFLSPLEEREGYVILLLAVERKEENVGKNLKAFEYYEYTATLSFPVPVSIRSCSESNLSPNRIFKKHL